MNGYELFKAMNAVKEEYVKQSEQFVRPKRGIPKAVQLAVGIAAVLAVFFISAQMKESADTEWNINAQAVECDEHAQELVERYVTVGGPPQMTSHEIEVFDIERNRYKKERCIIIYEDYTVELVCARCRGVVLSYEQRDEIHTNEMCPLHRGE